MRPRAHLFSAIAVLVTLGVARAALAGPDDRSAAESTLKEVESSPRRDVTQELTARAHAALDRGAKLRSSGDETRARIADGVARTWAEAARDVLRAAETEERAADKRRAATDAGAIADRERALLEEGIAQTGRLRAQLESTTAGAKSEPARTSTQANAPDGGAKSKPAPAPAPAKDGGAR